MEEDARAIAKVRGKKPRSGGRLGGGGHESVSRGYLPFLSRARTTLRVAGSKTRTQKMIRGRGGRTCLWGVYYFPDSVTSGRCYDGLSKLGLLPSRS